MWGWQFSGIHALHEAYVPLFGEAMVARSSANPLGCSAETSAVCVSSGDGGPADRGAAAQWSSYAEGGTSRAFVYAGQEQRPIP
jgi:hypothetical protein